MPIFAYKASTSDNEIKTGTLAAASEYEAATMLSKQGLSPISFKATSDRKKMKGSIPDVDKITFCRYVATMLNSGLSLGEGMTVLKEETKSPLMRQILDDILYNLERGKSLSSVFAAFPDTFNQFFITLTKAGEVSGTLANSFVFLERELKAEYQLKSSVKSALMYPMIVIMAMVAIGFLMLFFIMPQIGKVFLNMAIPLPNYTKFIFSTAVSLASYRWLIMGGSMLSVIVLALLLRTRKGKAIVVGVASNFPVIKQLIKQVDVARFTRIFSTLLAAAVGVTEALSIAVDSLSYPAHKVAAAPLPKEVSQGKTLAASFREHQVFPALLTQMIAAGEKSGTLDVSLADLATFYEEEVKESVKKATQLLEPILMLLVGIGVGAMILSIIAPLYSVVGNLQQGL